MYHWVGSEADPKACVLVILLVTEHLLWSE